MNLSQTTKATDGEGSPRRQFAHACAVRGFSPCFVRCSHPALVPRAAAHQDIRSGLCSRVSVAASPGNGWKTENKDQQPVPVRGALRAPFQPFSLRSSAALTAPWRPTQNNCTAFLLLVLYELQRDFRSQWICSSHSENTSDETDVKGGSCPEVRMVLQ